MGDELAVVEQGRVARVLQLSACAGVLPCISTLTPIALHTSAASDPEGGRVLVRGRSLTGPQARLVVRSAGELWRALGVCCVGRALRGALLPPKRCFSLAPALPLPSSTQATSHWSKCWPAATCQLPPPPLRRATAALAAAAARSRRSRSGWTSGCQGRAARACTAWRCRCGRAAGLARAAACCSAAGRHCLR